VKAEAMLQLKVLAFFVASAGILWLSWSSLRDRRSHGFCRFFAFESILLLILLNLENWFMVPFSAHQIISWLLLLSSIVLAVHGFHLLHRIGKPRQSIENTTILVRQGAYQYIRHPLYGSLMLLAWGVFFKGPSPARGILALAASICLFFGGRVEERENLERFGDEYHGYMKSTKMFIPYLF
jgi:protein-S-isoprenylcysteine O-methyltransferase Ste14